MERPVVTGCMKFWTCPGEMSEPGTYRRPLIIGRLTIGLRPRVQVLTTMWGPIARQWIRVFVP